MALIAQMFEGEAGGRAADRRAELDRLRLLVDATGTAPRRRLGADVAPEGDDAGDGDQDGVPVLSTLRPLLPGGVLRRGSVVAVEDWVRPGSGPGSGLGLGSGPGPGAESASGAVGRRGRGGGVPSRFDRPQRDARWPAGSAAGSAHGSVPGAAPGPRGDAAAAYPAAPSYLALALAAGASAGGGWCGVVGLPAFGIAAAAGLGADLGRMLLLDEPGDRWAEAVAVLAGAVDLILVRPPGRPTAEQLRRITARLRKTARQRGAALIVAGPWHGAHLTLRTTQAAWTGLGTGQGHLTGRRVTVVAEGRGAEGRARHAALWLPAADGSVASASAVALGDLGRADRDEQQLAEVVRLRTA